MSESAVPQELISQNQKRGLWIAVALGVVLLVIGATMHAPGVYSGALIAFLFILDLGLGGVLFVMINNSAGARWDTVFRRVPEAMATTLLTSAALVLVLVWAVPHVYVWARPGFMDNPIPELAGKKNWLTQGAFSLRALIYVAIWTGMLYLILRKYWAQDRDGVDRRTLIRKMSMGFMILFAYSFSLAAFDWLMSLEPDWTSTIFGVYHFAGLFLSALAAVTLLAVCFRRGTPLQALVTEDRKARGLHLASSICDNVALPSVGELSRFGIRAFAREAALADDVVERLSVRCNGIDQIAATLSGGNQQKVVIGKWLATEPRILLLDEPTRGIDVGAKQEIYQLVFKLAAEGLGIVVVSSEMLELLLLSDRVLVMCEGRQTGVLPRAEATQEAIMRLAAPGVAGEAEADPR